MSSNPPPSCEKKRLDEISIIRPIIIISLVLNHAFVKIAYGGMHGNNFVLPEVYQWVNWFNFDATLELFVLVSGYVFAFQCVEKKHGYSLGTFVLKKAHRLLLPMLAFGIVYYFCFLFNPVRFSIADFIINLLSGCGHLWFLPMLFWCLFFLWVLDYFHLDGIILLISTAVLSLLPSLPLPFGLATVPHYFFYVFLGYYLYKHKDVVWLIFARHKWIIPIIWILYFSFVWVKHGILGSSIPANSFFVKGLLYLGKEVIGLCVCLCAVFALYSTIVSITKSVTFELCPFVKKADKLSFGIYIYHQFILVALYHYTPIVFNVNKWLLPWVGFIIAIALSWLITLVTLRTRWGRYLIG